MTKVNLSYEEAFEMREALEKMVNANVKYPLAFSFPVMRVLRVLNRAYKDYQKAVRKTHAAQELEKFNKEQVQMLDDILKKDHVGNYLLEGEGQNRRNVFKDDPATAQKTLDHFWKKWSNYRDLQQEQQNEETSYREKDFDEKLHAIRFSVIPHDLEPEYLRALLPLIEEPDEALELIDSIESEQQEAA